MRIYIQAIYIHEFVVDFLAAVIAGILQQFRIKYARAASTTTHKSQTCTHFSSKTMQFTPCSHVFSTFSSSFSKKNNNIYRTKFEKKKMNWRKFKLKDARVLINQKVDLYFRMCRASESKSGCKTILGNIRFYILLCVIFLCFLYMFIISLSFDDNGC